MTNADIHDARELRRSLHEQGMAAVPYRLLDDHRLSDAEIRLALFLARGAWQNGDCYWSNAGLARKLGCSERSIRRSLKGLVDAGWVAAFQPSDSAWRTIRLLWRRPKPGAVAADLDAIPLAILALDKSGHDEAENGPESGDLRTNLATYGSVQLSDDERVS